MAGQFIIDVRAPRQIGKNCRGTSTAYIVSMRNKFRFIVCMVFLVSSGVILGENQREPDTEVVLSETDLELKARISNLERQLAGAKSVIIESGAGKEAGYMETLERKALAYESASSAIAERDRAILDLKQEVDELAEENKALKVQVEELVSATNQLSAQVAVLQKESEPIKEALTLIRKGKFEYYQIKEGDTCESIAAKPSIYNDARKQILIRQANRGGVADLDQLVPGEVLVIPRFSIGESYEF